MVMVIYKRRNDSDGCMVLYGGEGAIIRVQFMYW